MLKRQMFGRAYLDLLSRRFVRAPAPGQERAQRPQELLEADAGATASPYFTKSGKEPLFGTGFLAMLSRHAGEDRHIILAHHHWCPADVCSACAAISCNGGP